MAASRFYLPFRPAIDANALRVVPNAKLYFYAVGTSNLQSVYADTGLTIPLANPVTANAAGRWPAIYLSDASQYRVVLKDANDAILDEEPLYIPGFSSEVLSASVTEYAASGVIFDTARGNTFSGSWTVPSDATLTNVGGELVFNSPSTAKNLRLKLKNLAGSGDFKGTYEDSWETDFTIQLLGSFSAADIRAIECGFITDDVRISTNYFGARLGSHPGTATQLFGYLDNYSSQISTDTSGYTYSVGDTIRIRVKRQGNLLSRTVNYNGGADLTLSLTANFTIGNTELPRLLQTPFFNFVRGYYKLTSAKVSIGNTSPALGIVGTSLSQGRYVSSYELGFAQRIKNLHPTNGVAVFGAPSGTSADILGSLPDIIQHYRPKALLFEPFANDVLMTVALSTTQANIASIVALCESNNVRPLFMNSPPLNSTYATAINSWLLTTSYTVFDCYSILVGTGTALNPAYSSGESGSPDGIHWNSTGAGLVATPLDAWLVAAGVFSTPAANIIIDTDGTLAANSDSHLPTQKAVKTYVDSAFSRGSSIHSLFKVPTGSFLIAAVNASNLTTGTPVGGAASIEFVPFIPARDTRIDRLDFEVTSATASSSAHLGIYADNGSGSPGNLIDSTSSAINTSTTGVKTSGTDIGPLTLEAGTIYWLAFHPSHTITTRQLSPSSLAILHNAGSNNYGWVKASQTFGFLPSTSPAVNTTGINGAAVTAVRLRTA